MKRFAATWTVLMVVGLVALVGCAGADAQQPAETESSQQSIIITSKSQVTGASAPSAEKRSTSWDAKCKGLADDAIETMELLADNYTSEIASKKYATAQECWDAYSEHLSRLKATVDSVDSSYAAYENMGCDAAVTALYSSKVHSSLHELSNEMSDVTEMKVAEGIGNASQAEKTSDKQGGDATDGDASSGYGSGGYGSGGSTTSVVTQTYGVDEMDAYESYSPYDAV